MIFNILEVRCSNTVPSKMTVRHAKAVKIKYSLKRIFWDVLLCFPQEKKITPRFNLIQANRGVATRQVLT